LSLQANVNGETMRIVWDRNAPVLRDASSGMLTIRDGALLRNVSLSAKELRTRNGIAYAPTTNEVELRLEISGAKMPKQSQSVLVVIGPANQPPIEAEVEQDPHTETPARTQLTQTVSIRQLSGEGIRSGVYQRPEPIGRVKPALSAQLEPLVRGPVEIDVRIMIDSRGRVITARPVSQTGALSGSTKQQTQITRAVLDAALRWSFRPAQINSRTVSSELVLAFQFAKES